MSERDRRYPPVGDYGMIGDLRSAALISKHGSIDWMCLPRFDSPWIFGRLLDWDRGGYLELGPPAEAPAFRQYRRDSNVMQTIWSTDHARMRVVDWMPIAIKNKSVRTLPRKFLRPSTISLCPFSVLARRRVIFASRLHLHSTLVVVFTQ